MRLTIIGLCLVCSLLACKNEPKPTDVPAGTQNPEAPEISINDPDIQEKLANMKPSANNRGLIEIKGVDMSRPISASMVNKGKYVYDSKCATCHSADGSSSPASGIADLLDRRAPAWIMNMIYNPTVDVAANGSERNKLNQCFTRQEGQALSIEEARDFLEFLRTFKEVR